MLNASTSGTTNCTPASVMMSNINCSGANARRSASSRANWSARRSSCAGPSELSQKDQTHQMRIADCAVCS